mmetsp:Transcript_27076/g.56388  ORF Transcript_27076/g.56388 Transcript_27076/m.56388 type:complete len:324 (+) Transcript_27076:257-1228(+)
MTANADANLSDPDDTSIRRPNPVVDDQVLERIRSILVASGITANMIDFPTDSMKGSCTLEMSTSDMVLDEVDIEKDTESKGRWGSWLGTKMGSSAMASRRNKLVVDTTDEYPIAEDVYNLFFLSKNWSLPFWYTIFTVCNKLSLFGVALYWIYKPDGFRDMQNERGETPPIVQATQFLLIPVAIGITEELMITMDVLSKMGWKKMENRPQATRLKYWIANTFRALDGLFWLLIITSLMLYAVDVLEMFLNFAALQFLQCVDNSAYEVAKGSYLTSALEFVAIEVSTTTLPSKRSSWKDYLDSLIFVTIVLLMVIAWALVNFLD